MILREKTAHDKEEALLDNTKDQVTVIFCLRNRRKIIKRKENDMQD
jgi:hypothetical protein